MTVSASPHPTTTEKLLQAVLAMSANPDVGGLSLRAVADAAGVSPSAVNYIFGSLAGLLGEAARLSDMTIAGYWDRAFDNMGGLPLQPADFASLVFLTTRRLVVDHPGEQTLFWKDVVEAARTGRPALFGSCLEAERQYWSGLLRAAGLGHVRSAVLLAFSLALRFAYQVHRSPDAFDPWALAIVNRFSERLAGGAAATATDSVFRQCAESAASLSDTAAVPGHETAQLVVRATVETIMEAGADAATFREIARRAGLSVSSVQHFFGSRRAFLVAAFHEVYATARDRAVRDVPPPGTLSIGQLAGVFASEQPGSPLLPRGEYAAMQGLMLSASETEDTRALAEGLLARAGQTSMHLLRALKSPRGEIGRLDAQILSLTFTQLVTLDVAGQLSVKADDEILGLANNLLVALFD